MAILLIGLAGSLFTPFVAVISAQMKRIEGSVHPLAYAQLGLGAIATLLFIAPTYLWMAATFDPGGSPATTQVLNAGGWQGLTSAIFPGVIQMFVIAIASLTDRRANPVFPRWVGYLNLWTGLLTLPSALILFFKDQPFAWNGILTFWLGAVAFTIWLVAMIVVLLRAIAQQEAEA